MNGLTTQSLEGEGWVGGIKIYCVRINHQMLGQAALKTQYLGV